MSALRGGRRIRGLGRNAGGSNIVSQPAIHIPSEDSDSNADAYLRLTRHLSTSAGQSIQPTSLSTFTFGAGNDYRNAAERFFKEGTFSDLTILCEVQELKVHRVFVCAHSKWFQTCCSGSFRESASKRVTLEEDLFEVVLPLIKFCYTWDFDDDYILADLVPEVDFDNPKPVTPLELNALVYAAAEKYDMPSLKKLAIVKFRAATSKVKMQSDAVQVLPRATSTVYKHALLPESDRALKEATTGTWDACGLDFFKSLKHEVKTSLMRELSEFGVDLAARMMERRDQSDR